MADHGACFIMFRADRGVTMDQLSATLSARGLHVAARDGGLRVRRPDSPVFDVHLTGDPWVREEAAEISSQFAPPQVREALAACDARIELAFDLEQALAETNTLIELVAALQGLTGGHAFNLWNQALLPP